MVLELLSPSQENKVQTLNLIDELFSLTEEEFEKIMDEGNQRENLFLLIRKHCLNAYQNKTLQDEFIIHYTLFRIFRFYFSIPKPGLNTLESSYTVYKIRNIIERAFLENEDNNIDRKTLNSIPKDWMNFKDWLYNIIHSHPAYKHPLYEEHLRLHATAEDLKFLILQESTIDASTDDFLALVQIGTDYDSKMEMAKNYWDEMGNGDESKIHSVLFTKAISHFNLNMFDLNQNLETEALICGNLQYLLSMRREYFYKAIGYFAVLEYMAPRRFKCLMKAWKRNKIDTYAAEYHKVHITTDVGHAQSWYEYVIKPTISKNSKSMEEIAKGALYRLNTSKRYLDSILPKFPSLSQGVL